MAMNGLEDLYFDELRDVYNAENQIVKALPRLAKAAQSDQLRNAFNEHLDQTKNHVTRLEQIFQMHDMKARGKKCQGMEGIVEENKEMMQENIEQQAMDAALIAGAQKVEHYEIATYGTLRTWAKELGFANDADLLQQTLNEEGDTDHKLTRLAEARANPNAEQAPSTMPQGPGQNM